jgi:hypothetical protein
MDPTPRSPDLPAAMTGSQPADRRWIPWEVAAFYVVWAGLWTGSKASVNLNIREVMHKPFTLQNLSNAVRAALAAP